MLSARPRRVHARSRATPNAANTPCAGRQLSVQPGVRTGPGDTALTRFHRRELLRQCCRRPGRPSEAGLRLRRAGPRSPGQCRTSRNHSGARPRRRRRAGPLRHAPQRPALRGQLPRQPGHRTGSSRGLPCRLPAVRPARQALRQRLRRRRRRRGRRDRPRTGHRLRPMGPQHPHRRGRHPLPDPGAGPRPHLDRCGPGPGRRPCRHPVRRLPGARRRPTRTTAGGHRRRRPRRPRALLPTPRRGVAPPMSRSRPGS